MTALRRSAGAGAALPEPLGTRIGDQLGVDLSAVRVHTDGQADQLARSVQAVAFTHGSDIFFTAGAFNPDESGGQRLLAHELSHVADVADGHSGGPTTIGRADDPAEARADASADRIVQALRRSPSRSERPARTGRDDAGGQEPRSVSTVSSPIHRHHAVRRWPLIRRQIDKTTPAGTEVRRGQERFRVIGIVSLPGLGDVLQLESLPGGQLTNVQDGDLSQYDLVSGGLAKPNPNLGRPLPKTPTQPTPVLAQPTPVLAQPTPVSVGVTPVSGGLAKPNPNLGRPLPKIPTQPTPVLAQPTPVLAQPVIPPGAVTPTQLAALTVDVPDSDLDEGSKLLKVMRSARPDKVNDALADKLSNCAIATIAAITGAPTSGAATADVRATLQAPVQGKPAQSEKLWTIAMLDADLLAKNSFVADVSTKAARNLDDISLGRSYVLGSAQYHLMIKYLMSKAGDEGTSTGVTPTIHRKGLPGDEMFDEATLIKAMHAYPNGTRFAVFVHSSGQQEVSAHWVYAERFNGKVIFQDFQTNTGPKVPADAYLEKFPLSPNKRKDAGKGFDDGCFIAIAPPVGTGPAIPDAEVAASEIDAEIAEARAYALAWSEKLGSTTKKLASTWALSGGARLDQIPAPVAIRDGYASIAGRLGVTAVSRFDITQPGVISIVGHPHVKTVGKQTQIEFDNLNPVTMVKVPGQAAKLDPTQLNPGAAPLPGKFSEAATDSQVTAFSKSYNVMAQNTTSGIEINAERGAFTDLIHEAAHAYEAGEMPAHIREGLAEVFASMVSSDILQTTKDAKFAFEYNPAYAPFVVAAERLITALGLTALADLYFQSKTPRDDLKGTVAAATGADPATSGTIVDDLFSEKFPGDFFKGIAEIDDKKRTHTPVAPTTVPSASDVAKAEAQKKVEIDVYRHRKASFATMLEAERAGLQKKGLKIGADSMELAQALDTEYGKEVMEKRLGLLYTHLSETEGEAFAETMNLVYMHEVGIGKVTGESIEKVRLRIKGSEKF